MGKGSRNRAAYETEKVQKREALIKAQKKQKITKRVTIAVVAVLLVAAITGGVFAVVGSINSKNRTAFHNTVAASSKNYEVTTAMMSYFFNLQYMTFQNNNYNSLSSIKIDTTKSLKDQTCDPQFAEKDGQTWYDYFYNLAEKQVVQMLSLLEAAKADGFELSEADKETMKLAEQEMLKAADEYDMDEQEYLDYVYGKGIKKSEVMKAMEYYQLSSSYYTSKYDGLEYTAEDIAKHYEENKKLFTTVDYLAYAFTASLTSYGNDENARNAAISTLRERAKVLSEAKSIDEYKANLKTYLDRVYSGTATYTTVDPDEEYKNSQYTNITYIEDNDVCDWAFSDNAKVGDLKVFEEEIEGVYYISVAMLTKTMTRDETVTRDIRHILFTTEKHGSAEAAKAKAQEMLTTFNAGSGSEADFAALATENTEDPGSQTTGGLYKGVTKGQMVEPFDNWMFAENRKKGDTGLVESSHGCHVMYYPGVENTAWQTSVRNALVNDVFEADVEELKEKYNVQAKNQDITEKELDY